MKDKNVKNRLAYIKSFYGTNYRRIYREKMHKLLNKKVMLQMLPTNERDGYFGKKKIFKLDENIIDLHQARKLDRISYIDGTQDEFTLNNSFNPEYNVSLPITKIHCSNLYNPLLLSYYFSGFNDKNPLNSFLGYYNVLEYYFELQLLLD